MSSRSNDQGRAFEFIFLKTLEKEIGKRRPVEVVIDSAYIAAERAWQRVGADLYDALEASSEAAVSTIFELEPMILEDGSDSVEIRIQTDDRGVEGDVRDILIIRRNVHWEIGLSLKHNHFAVKHSRLSGRLDFGEKWFGVPCSEEYWQAVGPIFEYLKNEKEKGSKWRDLPAKEDDVYIPLLNAFVEEVLTSYRTDPDIPAKMVEYLLGYFDFYKVISIDRQRMSQIQAYNLRGTLNLPSRDAEPEISVPISSLPTRIVAFERKPESNNTVELYMDNGWQFSFRIHNASTRVEPSLKFDVQIIGMPVTVVSIDCYWKK